MITRDESTEFIKNLVANPETEMANVGAYLDSIGELYDSIAALTQKNQEYETRVRELQDTNTRLVLAQLGEPAEPVEEREMTLEEFAHNM